MELALWMEAMDIDSGAAATAAAPAAATAHDSDGAAPPLTDDEEEAAGLLLRAAIVKRVEMADTDRLIALHEDLGGLALPDAPARGYNSRLVTAGRRLLVAKAMHPRLGRAGALFQHLSLDLITSVGCAIPSVPSLSGEWRVRGAFHHGEQYDYRMCLTEHPDGTVTGEGKFHEHNPYAPTFVVTRALVLMCADPATGQRGGAFDARQPVLYMRQESAEFTNFCSCVLSSDRSRMVEGEWLQLDLTEEDAWDEYQASPFTVPKPQPSLESFCMWGWWGGRRITPALLEEEARDAQALAARNRELALRQQAARDVNAAAGAGLPKHQARHLPAPLPGVIGTPRQWAADAPLRRPPPCISDPVCERGVWADPDPTAKPDEHDYDGAAARQAQRRRTDDDQVLDTW